jgi:hypothetical protein
MLCYARHFDRAFSLRSHLSGILGTWFNLIMILASFLLLSHWCGCIFWAIGVSQYNCLGRPACTCAMDTVCSCGAGIGAGTLDRCGAGIPWIIRTETRELPTASFAQQCLAGSFRARAVLLLLLLLVEHLPPYGRYLSSLYWSLSAMVKTPWVGPDTIGEKVWVSLVVLGGTILFAAALANATAMVKSLDEASMKRRSRLAAVRSFMGFHNLPSAMQRKLLDYAEAEWVMTHGMSTQETLGQLPPVLRSQVIA